MDVRGTIRFLADDPLYDSEKPFGVTLPADYEAKEGDRLTNLHLDERVLDIHDMRPLRGQFTLDTAGFTLIDKTFLNADIESNEALEGYQRETEEMLQQLLKPEYLLCWNARLRKAERLLQGLEVEDLKNPLAGSNPVDLAHTDETIMHGHESIELYMPKDLHEVYPEDQYRIRMINTWRPLMDELEHYPLAVLDFRSADPLSDFVGYDQVSPVRSKELYVLKARESHRWFWASRQNKSELLVFVQYDSSELGQARCCPHAGFHNHNAATDAPLRRSVETRTIVVTKK